jgi:hypothetical protein
MTNYISTKVPIPTSLDDLALRLSITRFQNEPLADFRDRVLAEARQPSEMTQVSFINELSRQLGLRDIPVCTITLAMDGNDYAATDPYLEVTSTRLRYYRNYATGVPDIDVDLQAREEVTTLVSGDGYYDADASRDLVVQIVRILSAEYTLVVSFPREWSELSLSVDDEVLDAWLLSVGARASMNLKFSNTSGAVNLLRASMTTQQILPNQNIKEIRFSNTEVFKNQKYSIGDVLLAGDYYVDYQEGVAYSFTSGDGFISYTYRDFPFRLTWQHLRAYPYADADLDYRHKDMLVDDDGIEQPLLLNSEGAKIANHILEIHPLGWGK